MKFCEVSPVGIVSKTFNSLTYSFNDNISAGQIVEIEIGNKRSVGVVLNFVNKPDFEVKPISRILFDQPLPLATVKLNTWISEFYSTHPGTVWQTILPEGLNKNHRKNVVNKSTTKFNSVATRTNFVLNTTQVNAIQSIISTGPGTTLLHGITGSGKTEVYKALALEAKRRKLSSIILVPEISLTAQLVDEFRRDFEKIIVTHSSMTSVQRFKIWLEVLNTKEPIVIIGPRSALFMPIQNLGLIVIDECHEPSYKQEKAPRYNTLRVASVLSQYHQARLVLGSATPSITDYYTAIKLNRPIVKMTKLARSGAKKPKISIVDLTKKDSLSSQSTVFSKKTISAIEDTIKQKKQVLIFHNRRGSASITLCTNCGWSATCPNCLLPLTLHSDKFKLLCHVCGHTNKPMTQCPDCKNTDIKHRGIGTKRIEEEIIRLFPNVKVKRFDGDTERGQAVQDIFKDLHSGEIDIIIGTQTIAKGLDLPKLRLVSVVQADSGLALPDFSSSERTFQLIAQASGRVGRGIEDTEVIIQTFQPEHPAIKFGVIQNYQAFYESEIQNRAIGHFPPFAHLMKMACSYKTEKGAINASKKLATNIKPYIDENTKILGPAPAFYEHAHGNFRWQIIIRSSDRRILTQISSIANSPKWQVELDPISLI